jgi:hypothetical protein
VTTPRFRWKRRVLRHRRPWPVVPLLAAAIVAVIVTVVVGSHRTAADDPPVRQELSPAALASEDSDAQAPPNATPERPRRQAVDVVDAEAAPPRRISIPAIGVSARVIPLGLRRDRTMRTPRDFADTGWYEPGAEPGERGAAVVVGHVDSRRGPAAFYRLRRLRRGDAIRISRTDGSVVRFRVEGLERWPKAAFPTRRVFRRTRVSALRLVTCSGEFDSRTGHYVDNTIVFAVRERRRRRST